MQAYTQTQIELFTLLIFFFFIFFFKVKKFLKKFKNKSLLKRNKTLKKLKRLSWDDFELLVMELFVKKGWKVSGNEKKVQMAV